MPMNFTSMEFSFGVEQVNNAVLYGLEWCIKYSRAFFEINTVCFSFTSDSAKFYANFVKNNVFINLSMYH